MSPGPEMLESSFDGVKPEGFSGAADLPPDHASDLADMEKEVLRGIEDLPETLEKPAFGAKFLKPVEDDGMNTVSSVKPVDPMYEGASG